MWQHRKAKYKVGDIVQTPYSIVGRRHDGVGRIKSVGVCTMELRGNCLSLGIMYQIGSRQFLEEQLKPIRGVKSISPSSIRVHATK